MRAKIAMIIGSLLLNVVVAAADNATQPAAQPWTGIIVKDYVSDTNPKAGAIVDSVETDSPAVKIGVVEGDVVTMWGGKKISSKLDFDRTIGASSVGKRYTIGVVRNFGGKWRFSERPVVVGVKPAQVAAVAEKEKGDLDEVTSARLETMGEKYVKKTVKMTGIRFSDVSNVWVDSVGDARDWIGFGASDLNGKYFEYFFASKKDYGELLVGLKRDQVMNVQGRVILMNTTIVTRYGLVCTKIDVVPTTAPTDPAK